MIGPACLIQRSVRTGNVDRTCGIGKQTGSVVDEGFSAVHCAVSVVIDRLADAASEGIVLILHRFCHHVCGRFEGDGGQLIGVVPRVFGLGSGGNVGFAGLVAFQIISVGECAIGQNAVVGADGVTGRTGSPSYGRSAIAVGVVGK